ncbi:MAG: hypothetical protein IJ711_09920 [Lachnospiraceae bacterium]|nr:hypothetical protein [Lachnospiraceae bacterium]
MSDERKKPKMPELFEAFFCIAYLLFDLVAAVVFFSHRSDHKVFLLYGILTAVLGIGDAFHLVPRIGKAFFGERAHTQWWLGLGLCVSSITMTFFYVLLFCIWRLLFEAVAVPAFLSVLLLVTAAVRVILCLFPQNHWFEKEGNPLWSKLRNAPFVVTGLCMMTFFCLSGNTGGYGLWKMAIAIFISFACYIPVTLYAKQKPMIGMLMIPKTVAYIWMICMGLRLLTLL